MQVRDQQNVGRGRGRGRSNESGQSFNNNSRNSRPDLPEIHYAVPANKCGLVIGKGDVLSFYMKVKMFFTYTYTWCIIL